MKLATIGRIAFLCSWLLVLGACQSNTNGQDIEIQATSPVEQQNSLQAEQTDHTVFQYEHIGLSKYEEPISITFLRELTPSLVDLVNNLPNETVEDNRWTRLYRDVLGIEIKYDWTDEGDFYRQKLNYAIASGQITDVIRVNADQLSLLNSTGLIHDLSEVYNEYATPLTKENLSQEGTGPFDAATIDGKLMAIPDINSSIDGASFIWLRTDWLERLELTPPQTIDDVIEIARAFTELDPDGNGEDDTYGLALTNYLWDPVMGVKGFMAGYDVFPELWIEKEVGKLVFGGIQPEVKEALKALQTMYAEGLLDPEFSFRSGGKVKEQITKGKIGMMYGEQWGSFFVQASRGSAENVEWKAYPIVSLDGSKPKVPLKFNVTNFYVVRKDFEHPEALIKLFNLHLEKNWGETGAYETYYSSPYPVWQLSPVFPYPARKNFNAFLEMDYARASGDFSKLNPEAKAIQKQIDTYLSNGTNKESGWGWNLSYGVDSAFAILKQYENNDQLLYEKYTGARTDTMIEAQSILQNLQHETYVNIILGNPIEDFDDFVEKWNYLGGEKITSEVNEWYRNNQH